MEKRPFRFRYLHTQWQKPASEARTLTPKKRGVWCVVRSTFLSLSECVCVCVCWSVVCAPRFSLGLSKLRRVGCLTPLQLGAYLLTLVFLTFSLSFPAKTVLFSKLGSPRRRSRRRFSFRWLLSIICTLSPPEESPLFPISPSLCSALRGRMLCPREGERERENSSTPTFFLSSFAGGVACAGGVGGSVCD